MAGFEPVTFRVTVGATSPNCRFPRPDAEIRLWTRRCDLLSRDGQKVRQERPMFRKNSAIPVKHGGALTSRACRTAQRPGPR